MGINIDIVFDYLGRLKLVTVGLGLVNFILVANSYHNDGREIAFLVAVVCCLLTSLFWVVAIVTEYIVSSDSFIRLDMFFHTLACLVLLSTNTSFLISILDYGKQSEKFGLRIVAMIVGYLNSSVYGYMPWTLLRSS